MPAILGTAGHIDHGKTALVRALTGQDTDRLKEEKERGISIDLGFAYFDLADGTRAGIVDVPGHERFIRNMLAGAHGIDVVLLVVAADDGVMPQTEEHLEIIHVLGVERGIAVITKTDLVSPQRVREVREEIAALLAGTRLAGSPMVEVSSVTGAGIDDLRAEIERQLAASPGRAQTGAFRLPVDRAFVLRGHGVVITGTAASGQLREGATLRILPGGEECRVRSLQVHGVHVAEAGAGQRIAINLSGVEKTEVARGHMLVDPRYRSTSVRLDAWVDLRPSAGRAAKNLAQLRLHLGTAAVPVRLHLLDGRAELKPRESTAAQLVLDEEIHALVGDRFVLRDETTQRTLGGGVVLLPMAPKHKRRDGAAELLGVVATAKALPERISALIHATRLTATPIESLHQILPDGADEIVAALRQASDLVLLPSGASPEVVMGATVVERIESRTLAHLAEEHRRAPLAPGVEMESVRTQVAEELGAKLFRAVVEAMAARGTLARGESLLRLPSHQVALAAPERALGARAEKALKEADLAPPDLNQLQASLQIPRARLGEILAQLEREGRVVKVSPEMYFAAPALEKARDLLTAHLKQHQQISAAIFRDLIHGSRKFSIALLDYFDRTGFTLRVGDLRKLRR